MSGYWSFREATASTNTPASGSIQESVSAQVLPYGREITMELQSATLAAYPWVHRDAAAADDSWSGAGDVGATAVKGSPRNGVGDWRTATADEDDRDIITASKLLSVDASPFSPHTQGRPDGYSEEDITLIEMDAESSGGDVHVATSAARRLPFETHCVRDLALDETQSTWWQRAVGDDADTTFPLDTTQPPVLQAVGRAESCDETGATHTAQKAVSTGVQVLCEALAPTEAEHLTDQEDRDTLKQMLAPHLSARTSVRGSASQHDRPARKPSKTRRASLPPATGHGAQNENDESEVVVVGRGQPLASRTFSTQCHRDPHTRARPAAPTAALDGPTFVDRMAQRAAERRRAREALKQQQAAHEAAQLAQRAEQTQHAVDKQKTADGRPAFTLYGTRCPTAGKPATVATHRAGRTRSTARAHTNTTACRRDVVAVSPQTRPDSKSRLRPRGSNSLPYQSTAPTVPCRTRITPLDDECHSATAPSPVATATSKPPRQVRFVDDEKVNTTGLTKDENPQRNTLVEPTHESVAAADPESCSPIPFHELAAAMTEDRYLAAYEHDSNAVLTIEREMALLASDYYALHLAKTALRRWHLRRSGGRTVPVAETAAHAPHDAASTAVRDANSWPPSAVAPPAFPSSPLMADFHDLHSAEQRYRDALVCEESQAFAAMVHRHQRLASALHTLLARTQQRRMLTLRWLFVAWVSLEEEHRLARRYREHLLDCARQTLADMGMSATY